MTDSVGARLASHGGAALAAVAVIACRAASIRLAASGRIHHRPATENEALIEVA